METLQRTANRGSISTGYDIDNSCKFEADNSEVMTHTYDSAPTSQKKMTISMWYKRTEVGSNIGLIEFGNDASGDYFQIRWGRDVYGSLETYGMRFGSTNFSVGNTYGAVRDTSAWYHIVVAIDTTQGTAANRFKVYRNGAELGWSTDNRATITQNQDLALGENGKRVVIGEGAYRYCGYIAEVNYIDGQQLTSTDFGEYDGDSGIWIPKAYTGTYGNNGFYLDYKNSGNLGEDQSGNNHDFTLTNIASSDQATDTPTNNFCTLALQVRAGTSSEIAPIREGGTYMPVDGTNQFLNYFGTIGVTKGKWYWEVYIPSRSASYGLLDYIGLHSMKTIPIAAGAVGGTSQCNYVLHYGDYNATVNGTNSGQNTAAGLPSYGTDGAGKTFGVAFNADDGEITFYANNTRIGNAGIDIFDLHDDMAAGTFVLPFFQVYDNDLYVNFGGCSFWASPSDYDETDANGYGSFAYAPPSGYYALCTKNLAEYG